MSFWIKRVGMVTTDMLLCNVINMPSCLSEGIKLEDMEDSERLSNQWLIRTPAKSFFVSASSYEQKWAWMEHIDRCQSNLLQGGGSGRLGSTFAVAWIPDEAAFKCMRCFDKFTATNRRHHCRQCGFLVCGECSARRAVIRHIHPTKPLRVCGSCDARSREDELAGPGGRKTNISEEEEAASSDEDERVEMTQSSTYCRWLVGQTGTYVYPRPMTQRPK